MEDYYELSQKLSCDLTVENEQFEMKAVVLFFVLTFSSFCYCANILAVIPSPFYSHQFTFRSLWKELSKRGHKITLITTDLMEPNENITQIDYSGSYEFFKKLKIIEKLKTGNVFQLISGFSDMMEAFNDYQFRHPGLLKLFEDGEKFDIMLLELLIPGFPGLSVKFNCPYIGLFSMDALPILHGFVGNAEHPAIYPYADFGYGDELSFTERFTSTAFNVFVYGMAKLLFMPQSNEIFRKYFGEGYPDAGDIYRNVSMIFTNSNPIFFPPRPTTPITLNIGGGLHIEKPRKLPKEIQDYLDESKDGCIYFSLGSTVNSNDLDEKRIQIFRKTFEELYPMRVLWKFENDTLKNKPKNLKLMKWLPQHDILRHPNVKIFITQGGLQSMEEAIDSAVPMIGIPFYGDQKNNVKKMVLKEFGLSLNIEEITEKSLKSSILELIENPKYKNNIEKLSRISKDQPMDRLEKTVWWIEYVLRHGGTNHLRSPSANIPLYQYFFLDIIGFLVIVLVFLILIFRVCLKLIRYSFRVLFSKRSSDNKRKLE